MAASSRRSVGVTKRAGRMVSLVEGKGLMMGEEKERNEKKTRGKGDGANEYTKRATK